VRTDDVPDPTCPRCGAALTTYDLGGSGEPAVNCDSCGFSGITVSHHKPPDVSESWLRALARFKSETVAEIDGPEATAHPADELVPEGPEADDSETRQLDVTDVPVSEALQADTDGPDSGPASPSSAGTGTSAFEDSIQVKEAIRPLQFNEDDAEKEDD